MTELQEVFYVSGMVFWGFILGFLVIFITINIFSWFVELGQNIKRIADNAKRR